MFCWGRFWHIRLCFVQGLPSDRSATLPPQPPSHHHHHHHHHHHQQQQQPPSALSSPSHQHLSLSPSHSRWDCHLSCVWHFAWVKSVSVGQLKFVFWNCWILSLGETLWQRKKYPCMVRDLCLARELAPVQPSIMRIVYSWSLLKSFTSNCTLWCGFTVTQLGQHSGKSWSHDPWRWSLLAHGAVFVVFWCLKSP